MTRPDADAAAVIRLGTSSWSLAAGEVLTFGRGKGRDIRFAHEPEDDYVSRDAGTFLGLSDGVLVRNESRTQPLVLQAFPGPETVIPPMTAMATLTHEQLRLVVPGRHGARYVVMVDTRGLRRASRDTGGDVQPELLPVRAVARPTRSGATKVTPREVRMLAALCEPLLLLAGREAQPATYKQIATRLDTTAASVKTCLDQLRARLSDVDGIPGLRGGEDDVGGSQSYVEALASWARHSGVITLDSLAQLPPGRQGPM